jgi:hypothetical protein
MPSPRLRAVIKARIEPQRMRELETIAHERGRKVSEILREALCDYVTKRAEIDAASADPGPGREPERAGDAPPG